MSACIDALDKYAQSEYALRPQRQPYKPIKLHVNNIDECIITCFAIIDYTITKQQELEKFIQAVGSLQDNNNKLIGLYKKKFKLLNK
jgi:alkyl hydroperoxide reductase subunit AhpC